MQTFAVLGSHPELSIAEIEAVTGMRPLSASEEVAFYDDLPDEITKLQARLGGTSKMGYVIGSMIHASKKEIVEYLKDVLIYDSRPGKISFGISEYDMEGSERAKELFAMQKSIGIALKNELKEAGLSSRYVVTKNPQLSSADVFKNHLLDRGAEFVFLVFEKELLIGRTEVVQDFADWSHRDYDRPARDAKRGMLPPKLARMMINLTGVTPDGSTILDPFCGSGTVLMEAAILGYHKLIGSDISGQAISDTKKNMEWLRQEGAAFTAPELKESTAANTKAFIDDLSVDAIASEPFLGQPRQGSESRAEIERVVAHLAGLYEESFATLAKLLKPGGVMVIASPVHYIGRDAFPVPTRDILTNLGLIERPIADDPIIYHRPGQYVGRDIVRFVKR